jgi:hypothetical protein
MTNCTQPYNRFDPAAPPPPLMTGEPNSFAYKTMTTRIPAILQTVIEDHAGVYPPQINHALHELYAEIKQGQPVRPPARSAPDSESWTEAWHPYRQQSWLDIPWYFAESYFYRRLLEAVAYFGAPGPGLSPKQAQRWAGLDPFLPRKQAELNNETPWQILALALRQAASNSGDSFRALLQYCMWGNRVDLSHANLAQSVSGNVLLEQEQENLVVDDSLVVLAHLQRRPGQDSVHVHFVSDNAGTELLQDLALADFLLRYEWAGQVTLHLKAQPMFVSDAMPADVEMSLAALPARPGADLPVLAARLESYRQEQRLHLRPDPFWNSSRFFWELPAAIQAELSRAYLVIFKGDANYRRLVGDSKCWPTTIPAAEAIPYFPAPLVALRTLKSEVIIGLKPGQAEALDRQDAGWRVNGRRGMIQAVLPAIEPA